ncbi:hypothetical protein WMY93_001615 [Mugilogobius chulae]|uniref:Uncharacterized protein n=1 Tax=Mugilogobius chulae TaxID=88201 RepID=A0AAW0PTX3_9GOBI
MEPRKSPFLTGIFTCLCFLRVFVSVRAQLEDGGGWSSSADPRLDDGGRCNIDVLDFISYKDFMDRFAYSRPVILRGLTDNTKFQRLCSKENLLKEYGDRIVRLSTANTYSYKKVDVPFRRYVEQILRPQTLEVLGNDTFFGIAGAGTGVPFTGTALDSLRSSTDASAGSVSSRQRATLSPQHEHSVLGHSQPTAPCPWRKLQ